MPSPRSTVLWPLATFLLLGLASAIHAEAITVNVTDDVRTTTSNPEGRFQGFGINIVGHSAHGHDWYASASQELRDKWVKTYWVDLDMRVMRLWCGNGLDITTIHTADQMYAMYHQYIDDVKKQQKNKLIMIFDPHSGWSYTEEDHSWATSMTEEKLRDYVVRRADVVKDLWTKYHWKMDSVEITNEPEPYGNEGGWQNPELRNKALVMTRLWREELDRRDLKDVKVLASTRSAINLDDAPQTIDAFKADPVALKAWGGYSFHSYGSGMLKSIRDKLKGVDVDIVQTESGGIPYLRGVALAISDINLGTTQWCHFQGYGYDRDGGSNDGAGGENTTFFNGIRFAGVINEGMPDMDVRPFTKFFYLRELAKIVTVGSRVHLCSTDRAQAPFTYMENTYGAQPSITATAAEQPDGRWGLIVFNASTERGLPPGEDYGYTPHPATTFDVTFQVPELAETGAKVFMVRKLTRQREELDLPDLTMHDGLITVHGLQPEELVSLRSADVLLPPTLSGISPAEGPVDGGTVATITGSRLLNATITFDGVPALSITAIDDGHLTCVTPPHANGTVDVAVVTSAGGTTASAAFTYTGGSGSVTVDADRQSGGWGCGLGGIGGVIVLVIGSMSCRRKRS